MLLGAVWCPNERIQYFSENIRALKEEGLSNKASKYIASLCKDRLQKDWNKDLYDILNAVKNIRQKYNSKPTPGADESREDFIQRCIPIVMKDNPGMENEQAVAICYSMWKNKN